MNKILREIVRPFNRLRRSCQANASTASTPTLTIDGRRIEYLAPARPLAEILPATDMAEITLFSRLLPVLG